MLCLCPENEAVTTGNSGLVGHVNLVRRQSGYGSYYTACSIAYQLLYPNRNGSWYMPAERRKCYPIRRTASRIDWWYIIFTPSTGQVANSFAFCIVFLLFCSPHCMLCMCVSSPFFFLAVSHGDPGVYLYALHQVGPFSTIRFRSFFARGQRLIPLSASY